MRILIVEDDPAVAAGIADGLAAAAIEAQHVDTGQQALDVAGEGFDLVVLDLGLPDIDGTDVCRQLRSRSAVPIIVVSARGDEMDRVLALELGADDYLVKPFGMRELLARIRAVTRRMATPSGAAVDEAAAVSLGRLAIDAPGRRVSLDDEPVHLTPTEFDLLSYLAASPGTVLRRSDILRDVWQTEWYGATKTLDAHVAAIRRKLGDPGWIESVRGVGFRFEVVAAPSVSGAAEASEASEASE